MGLDGEDGWKVICGNESESFEHFESSTCQMDREIREVPELGILSIRITHFEQTVNGLFHVIYASRQRSNCDDVVI